MTLEAGDWQCRICQAYSKFASTEHCGRPRDDVEVEDKTVAHPHPPPPPIGECPFIKPFTCEGCGVSPLGSQGFAMKIICPVECPHCSSVAKMANDRWSIYCGRKCYRRHSCWELSSDLILIDNECCSCGRRFFLDADVHIRGLHDVSDDLKRPGDEIKGPPKKKARMQ
jgi:hypothetical protein